MKTNGTTQNGANSSQYIPLPELSQPTTAAEKRISFRGNPIFQQFTLNSSFLIQFATMGSSSNSLLFNEWSSMRPKKH